MFELKSDIAVPTKESRYPFDKMEVGQCFDLPVSKDAKLGTIRTKIFQAKKSFQKNSDNPGFQIVTRYVHDQKVLRVWRTEDETQDETQFTVDMTE